MGAKPLAEPNNYYLNLDMTEPSTNPPLISVIIPTYRRAHELDRCIKSVLAEPGDFFEVVVGDDASPDDTPAVIQAHSHDPRLRPYRNAVNLGLQGNGLEVARRARGEYLFILTDDDCLLPGALAKVAQIIYEYPQVGYCLSDLSSVNEKTGQVQHVHRTFQSNRLLQPSIATASTVAASAWVLSRQILKRELVDWVAWERYEANIYFPIIVAGRLLLSAPSYYLADNLVMHTFFNKVYWEAFGRDELEIQFNLAADRYRCMRAILYDRDTTAEAQNAIVTWEYNSLKSYLYLSHGGFWDLIKGFGVFAAFKKLRIVTHLDSWQLLELLLFPFKIPFVRAWVNIKGILHSVPSPLLSSLRSFKSKLTGY